MNRVVVVGCPGAGKSTAARRLAVITGLPLIHLDRHYWQPGWVRPDSETWRATVLELCARPRWILDGNYGGTLDLRLAAADTLIHLDFSIAVCARRAGRRMLTGLGRTRTGEFAAGCPERIDWWFLWFVLSYRRKRRERDLARMSGFAGGTYRFTRPRELDDFLGALAHGGMPVGA